MTTTTYYEDGGWKVSKRKVNPDNFQSFSYHPSSSWVRMKMAERREKPSSVGKQ